MSKHGSGGVIPSPHVKRFPSVVYLIIYWEYVILGGLGGVGGFSERGRGVLHLGICNRGCCRVQLLEVLDGIAPAPLGPEDWWLPQRVQSTYMVQSMVSVVVLSLMVWVSIPPMGTWDPLGSGFGICSSVLIRFKSSTPGGAFSCPRVPLRQRLFALLTIL